jgi:hypothetical protein
VNSRANNYGSHRKEGERERVSEGDGEMGNRVETRRRGDAPDVGKFPNSTLNTSQAPALTLSVELRVPPGGDVKLNDRSMFRIRLMAKLIAMPPYSIY